jgi:alpha-L-fucosidase
MFGAQNLLDGDRKTYWTTSDDVLTPEVTFTFAQPVTFNVVDLREYLPLGQRIEACAFDSWTNGEWKEFAKATSIGNRRLVRLADPISAEKVRLRVTQAAACPAISEFGLYLEPR